MKYLIFGILAGFLVLSAPAVQAVSELDKTFPAGEPLPPGVTVPQSTIPAGYELSEGDMIVPEGVDKGVWEPNLWSANVVPYAFVEDNATAIFNYESVRFGFENNPPRLISTLGAENFPVTGFRVGQMIFVSGSITNDNDAASLYTVTAVTPNTIFFDAGDEIQHEAAGRSVILSPTISVSPLNQTRMLAAMTEWENIANIDFMPRTSEQNYLSVRTSTGNNASVGMPPAGAYNVINIVSWTSHVIICHELAHTLGVKHEQSRPDRETYVTINEVAISQTACSGGPCDHNFEITPTGRAYPTEPWGAIYDFMSMMHYGQYSFSINPGVAPTIICQPGYESFQAAMGQRDSLSFWDKKAMSYIYAEPDWTFLHAGSTTVNPAGTFDNPDKDFVSAINFTPAGGKLVILYPDTYSVSGTSANVIASPILIEAPTGGVILE